MQEMGEFNVGVSVISNGLEKYLTFTINKNLVFTDSTPVLNSSLERVFQICQKLNLNNCLENFVESDQNY